MGRERDKKKLKLGFGVWFERKDYKKKMKALKARQEINPKLDILREANIPYSQLLNYPSYRELGYINIMFFCLSL